MAGTFGGIGEFFGAAGGTFGNLSGSVPDPYPLRVSYQDSVATGSYMETRAASYSEGTTETYRER